jgi:glycosyltransferase involved in cell wall biosynthesis
VARAAAEAGAAVTVVQAAGVDAEQVCDGVRYVFVAEPRPTRAHRRLGLWATPGGARVARAIERASPDVVHVQGLGFPRQTARIAEIGAPVLVQDHGDRPPGPIGARVWRRALDRVHAIAFTAREQAEPFVAAGALAPDTPVVEVLESSCSFMPGDRAEAKRRTGMHGDPCCVWLGRLDANKDPMTALDAFERTIACRPGARLWMHWLSGPLETAVCERIARSPALHGRVHPRGPLDGAEVAYALRAADLLIQASHHEGSGYVVLEALACGTIPVVTDIPSFRRIAGGIGALFPPGDAAALAHAICSTETSPERRSAARAHFEAKLDFRSVGRELLAAYRAVLR